MPAPRKPQEETSKPPPSRKPTLAGTVIYLPPRGEAPAAAIITGTRDSIGNRSIPLDTPLPPGLRNPNGRLVLDTETHVHLHAFAPDHIGHAQALNVPFSETPKAGYWSWPQQ